MNKKKVLIVGAGICGCSLAKLLSDKGAEVTIMEKHDKIGGACSDSLDDCYYQDYGPHIFHTNDKKVWDFLSNFTKWYPYIHKVKALINGCYVPIPMNYNSIDTINSYSSNKLHRPLDTTYGNEYTLGCMLNEYHELGDFIFRKVFYNYSKKQWGEMPNEVVLNRVKAFRASRDDRYFTDKYQGMPIYGYSTMMQSMLSECKVELHSFVSLNDIKELDYDIVYYSGSLDELFDYKYGELSYRSCKFHRIDYTGRYLQKEAAVINYPNDYAFTRSSDYSWFLPYKDNNYVVYEYPCDYRRLTLLERLYPVQKEENILLQEKYVEELEKVKECKIIPIGRCGMYKYINMDKAVQIAFDFAEQYDNL